ADQQGVASRENGDERLFDDRVLAEDHRPDRRARGPDALGSLFGHAHDAVVELLKAFACDRHIVLTELVSKPAPPLSRALPLADQLPESRGVFWPALSLRYFGASGLPNRWITFARAA